MRMKKHAFVQKPLTHSIHEARLLGQVARENKVATQMGNQGTAIWRSAERRPICVPGWWARQGGPRVDRSARWPQGGPRPKTEPVPANLKSWMLCVSGFCTNPCASSSAWPGPRPPHACDRAWRRSPRRCSSPSLPAACGEWKSFLAFGSRSAASLRCVSSTSQIAGVSPKFPALPESWVPCRPRRSSHGNAHSWASGSPWPSTPPATQNPIPVATVVCKK